MANEPRQDIRPDDQRIFDLAIQGRTAVIASTTEEVSRQSEAIRQLDEITRQMDMPYVGSYYSV